MRTERFRGILLSTLLVTSLIASLWIATLISRSQPVSAQEETYFIKECMPDLGQHCVNWCWCGAAANSIYWWAENAYPQLIDDPADPTFPDNRYITDPLRQPPSPPYPPCPSGGYYRLLDEIAWDCGHVFCEPIFDNEYFYGLQKFIDDQGAPLMVHEIVDPENVWSPPPPSARVIYRPPTLEDYQRELERCQDVLLWLNFRHYEPYEDTDHVVTGVGFSYDNTWILVSDPWTPGAPDHNNLLDLKMYDNLLVINNDPLWVLYAGVPVQVSKLVYISPVEPECGVEVTIEPEHKRGTPCTWLEFVVRVHNTGNVPDNYLLTVENDGWPMENIYFESGLPTMLLEDVEPCVTENVLLYVHIPENAEPCTHKEIVVWAESEFCGATDNDNALVQVVSKYLHNVYPGEYPLEPGNWLDTVWHEIYPTYCPYYLLNSWEDSNMDDMVSPGDWIDLMDENENITYYYVKDVTCTLVLEWYENSPENTWLYLEYENGWDNYCWAWWDPLYTQWNEIRPEFCNRYLLVEWYDSEPYDGYLGWCDWVLLVDKVTGEYLELHVVEIVTDLVLCEIPPECGVEVTIEPKHNRGTPCTWLEFAVSVHNTGNFVDSYLLSVEPDGWPMENIYFEGDSLLNVDPCETRYMYLYVHIPENALPCTHKEIVVWAESEFCGATDNDNALIQVVSKYLHNVEPGGLLEPGNWLDTIWHEIYPTYCQYYLLNSWYDSNMDGWVSPGDQIDLMDENENITWYYVKDVTITLVAEDEWEYTWYLELEGGWENYWDIDDILMDPENTQWNMISPWGFSRWRLSYWEDEGDNYLGYCDYVYMEYKPLFEYGEWVHVVDVATDLVLCEMPPGCGVEVTIEPEHKRGTPGNEVFFYVSVHNTGTVQDNYILSIEPNGWPEEYFYLDDYRLENVEPCQTVTTYLEVFIPENAEPCTHKEIVVWAESEFCGATDNDNALIQVVSKYLHHVDPGGLLEPGNWLDTVWHEIRPSYCQYYLLNSWEDNNLDGVVSPGDKIDLMDESENITWYYVKDVTITLVVEEELGGYQWYLELEGGWENYSDNILDDPENTQWNMIRPYFCTQWLLSYWEDDGDGYLDYCDYVYIELKPFFDYWEWVHVVDVATDLVLCELPPPWTGTATISLENLYTVNVEKILDLNQGSKLVVKFYTYGDAYENENVIETFSPPWHVEENELAHHPEDIGVEKAKLVLTDGAGAEIATIATFTVTRGDLFARIVDIYLEWPFAMPDRKNHLMAEIVDIYLQWPFAPP